MVHFAGKMNAYQSTFRGPSSQYINNQLVSANNRLSRMFETQCMFNQQMSRIYQQNMEEMKTRQQQMAQYYANQAGDNGTDNSSASSNGSSGGGIFGTIGKAFKGICSFLGF